MTRSRGFALPALVLATLLALVGCSAPAASSAPSGETKTVTSAYGDVTVPASPSRVASVAYYTLWQLWSLDVTPVAALDYTDQLAAFTEDQKKRLADSSAVGKFREINFEQLAAAKPDLIIGDAADVDEATYRRLSAIAPTVVAGGGTARGDWQRITEEIAAAVGRTDAWEKGKADYEALRDETVATYRGVIDGNGWAVFSLAEPGQFSLQLPDGATGNMIVNELGMRLAPSVPVADPDAKGWQAYPLEQAPAVFADVTYAITFATSDGTIYPQIQEVIDSDVFQTTAVAKSGAITGLSTEVNDYAGAKALLAEIESKILRPLSE